MEGIDWTRTRIDPRYVDESSIVGTQQCAPWTAVRPEVYSRLNHSVVLGVFLMSKDRFLALLQERKVDTEHFNIKTFFYTAPRLRPDATEAAVLEFLGQLCNHCLQAGIYVPPVHTYIFANNLGGWYNDLPQQCIDHWESYDQLIYQLLTSKATGLDKHELVKDLLYEDHGYQLLWKLAQKARHPNIILDLVEYDMPRQSKDMDFVRYMQQWRYYLLIHYIKGVFFSDRFFIESFITNMSGVYNSSLKPLMIGLLRDLPKNRPVTIHWQISNLNDYICRSAVFCGIKELTPSTTPSHFSSIRARRQHPTAGGVRPGLLKDGKNLNEIDVRDDADSSNSVDIRQTDIVLDDELYCSVCALSAANTRTCYLCGSLSHVVAQCDKLKDLVKDVPRAKAVLGAIRQHLPNGGGYTDSSSAGRPSFSRPFRPGTPPADNRSSSGTRPVHALQGDDTDTDVTVSQLTDEDTSDFQQARN